MVRLLCDVWGELVGPQSSRGDSRAPLDAASQVRSTDVKPAGGAWFPFTHSSALSQRASARHRGSQACASPLVLMPSLFPGSAQPHRTQLRGGAGVGWGGVGGIKAVTAGTKPKQEHSRRSDLNFLHRMTSFPTQRGRTEYSLPTSERLYV